MRHVSMTMICFCSCQRNWYEFLKEGFHGVIQVTPDSERIYAMYADHTGFLVKTGGESK